MTWEQGEAALREWAAEQGYTIEQISRKILGKHFRMRVVGITARDTNGEIVRHAIALGYGEE
jgi:hypothetical protein